MLPFRHPCPSAREDAGSERSSHAQADANTNAGQASELREHVGDVANPHLPDQEVDEVFIANVKGNWYLAVLQGTDKLRAVVLAATATPPLPAYPS
ncbi:hypothetical protein AB0B31_36265 [Catellatospora citrea]|uniref:hypothetical protein n=1 Tax=Catellatospora citrea TaxID=53366 RepID=UPI0033FE6482